MDLTSAQIEASVVQLDLPFAQDHFHDIYDTPLLLRSALLNYISLNASVTKSTLVDLGSSENIFSASPPKFSDIPPIECSKAFPSTT